LRLEAVSAEAGIAHSLIRYHFGGKAGLVGALIDWLFHDTYTQMSEDISSLPEGDLEAEISAISLGLRHLFESPTSYRLYLDLSVACLNDDKMRPKLAHSFEGQRALLMEAMKVPSGERLGMNASALAAITCAFADGLAIQVLSDPGSVDLEHVFEVWEDMLAHAMRGHRALDEGVGSSD
jgi:AcrR family transcriptional regulator